MGVLLEKYSGIKLSETALQRIMSKYGLSARIRQNRKAEPCPGREIEAGISIMNSIESFMQNSRCRDLFQMSRTFLILRAMSGTGAI